MRGKAAISQYLHAEAGTTQANWKMEAANRLCRMDFMNETPAAP